MAKRYVVIALVLAVLLGGGAAFGTGALLVLIRVGMGSRAPVVACGTGSPGAPVTVTVGGLPAVAGYSADQIRNAFTVDQVRRQLGLPVRATQIAFMTAMVEGPNLLNPPGGDRDSGGMYQQRPSKGWGTREQVTDPVLATRAFFGMAAHTHNPGLTDIANWQTRRMGDVAQAVQGSASPGRYQTRAAAAAALMRRIGADNATTSDATTGEPTVGGASPVAAALSTPTACTNAVLSGAFGSWNTLKFNSLTNIRAGVAALAATADVFGLQELGDGTHRQAAATSAAGFAMTTDNTAVPIMYRTTRYTLLSQGRELAFPAGQHVESGVDGTVVGPKWVVWAELQDNASGARVALVNTHLLPSVQNNGKIDTSKVKRRALYNKHLRVYLSVIDRVRAAGFQTVATCDCNVSYQPDLAPIVAMRAHGMNANWADVKAPPSHGSRSIDYVWAGPPPSAQITGQNYGSDHRWIAVTYLSTAGTDGTGGGGAAFTSTCTVDRNLPRRNPTSCVDAIAKARAMTKQSCSWYQYCLGFTARAYGWRAGSGEYSAWTQWQNLDRLGYTHRGDRNPPPGALVFWKGNGKYGHIAIAVGGGKIASNDIRRRGCIDIVDWSAPETQWGQHYLGWSPPYYPKGADL